MPSRWPRRAAAGEAGGVAAAAGALYFVAMFSLGFLLGPLRELMLAPRLGAVAAQAIEAAPMLLAMVFAAPWAARVCAVPPAPRPLLAMGGVALLLLAVAESLLDLLFRGRMLWAERATTPEGWIGLALMAAFALMPLLRRGD